MPKTVVKPIIQKTFLAPFLVNNYLPSFRQENGSMRFNVSKESSVSTWEMSQNWILKSLRKYKN